MAQTKATVFSFGGEAAGGKNANQHKLGDGKYAQQESRTHRLQRAL